MRRAGNLDANHREIVLAFMALGCSVEPKLSRLGDGIPDLLVGCSGINLVVEVKDHPAGTVKGDLNEAQKEWIRLWRGQACVVRTAEDVRVLVGKVREVMGGLFDQKGGA